MGDKTWSVDARGREGAVSRDLCLLYSAARAECTLGKCYRKNSNQYSADSEITNRHVHLPLSPIPRLSATFRSQDLNWRQFIMLVKEKKTKQS